MKWQRRWPTGRWLAGLIPLVLTGCGVTMREPTGATVPWIRYEAEHARASVEPIGPTREYRTPESEATGRRAVRLREVGDYVEVEVARPANGMVVRYSIPDSEDGAGLEATLSVYINGAYHEKLHLSSRFSWVYGDFPWTNDPEDGRAHFFFDECRVLLPAVEPGDRIRLQVDPEDTAEAYLIDFLELESVPPPNSRPEGSLSLVDFGAHPDDGEDDAAAFLAFLQAAKSEGAVAWIPEGSFVLGGDFKPIGGVDVRGAGMWYSVLTGSAPMFYGTGERFSVADLSIVGEVAHRNDRSPDNAFSGNLGEGSEIARVWMEHLKCGVWSNHGTKKLRIVGCRIRNTLADGVNLCDGTTDSVVEQSHLRNTGDDALATWSPSDDWSSRQSCRRNRFLHNTVETPWHANGIGLYGGVDLEVRGNLVVDTVFSGGGLLISSGHGALPFEGTLRVENNRFVRTGGDCYIGEANGGLWVHANEADIDAEIVVRHLAIEDSAHAGITIHGPRSLRNASLENVVIRGGGALGIHILPSAGEVTLEVERLRVERNQGASSSFNRK